MYPRAYLYTMHITPSPSHYYRVASEKELNRSLSRPHTFPKGLNQLRSSC